jgi:hypothetical protein
MATRPAEEQADNESDSDVDGEMDKEDNGDSDSDIEAEEDDDRDKFKKGKEPMSPELLCNICSWLMAWGTVDAMFTLCFWYIRGILLVEATIPQGSGSAICLGILLMPPRSISNIQKGTSSTMASDKKRSSYSNPFECSIDHGFSRLALYLTTAFMEKQSRDCELFLPPKFSKES